jgi:hypothetical protein
MFWANVWLFIKELFEKDLGIPIPEIPEEE